MLDLPENCIPVFPFEIAGVQYAEVLKEAQKDGLPVEKLLSHKYALADINDAMEMNISMKGLKIVVKGE